MTGDRKSDSTADRLSIRKKTYRGVEGYSVTGRLADKGWPVSVFVAGTDRKYAERVKARLLAREDRIFEDQEG